MQKLVLLSVVSLFLLSCSGGGSSSSGGGGGVNSTPSISNLSYSPNQAAFNQGGGAITVIGTFNFIDNGGDLSTFTVFYYDQNGNAVLGGPYPIQGVNGLSAGTLRVFITLYTTTRGSFNGGLYVTDAGGRQSNRLTATFTVN